MSNIFSIQNTIKKMLVLTLSLSSLSGCGTFHSPGGQALSPAFNPPQQIAIRQADFGILNEAPAPRVVLVIANQDFWYQDYADSRQALEAAGLEVVVAAASTDTAYPHANSGQGNNPGEVTPDLALTDIHAEDYQGLLFLGGWGASAYQYAFPGHYANAHYNGSADIKSQVNALIADFVAQDKHLAALCHGVSVLAWARVNGQSLLQGRNVVAWNGTAPASSLQLPRTRDHLVSNGATHLPAASVGDPQTSADDVVVDGRIITGENFDSAAHLGSVLAQEIITALAEAESEPAPEPLKPVLMVIANQDFYYREFNEPFQVLQAEGIPVVVAASSTDTAYPHPNSGQAWNQDGAVQPDIALLDVQAEDYSSIVFVGGWGASSYQYAYPHSYDNASYNGNPAVKAKVNQLIHDFSAQDKYVTALCHGVSILAWARIDGQSPLNGKQVVSYGGFSPNSTGNHSNQTRWHIESNGAYMYPSAAVGNPGTSDDDVVVDGHIITAENYDSSQYFGEVLAAALLAD